ncbi:MAG: lipoate protein ligase C-terminal domain-containing protein [Candidatus Hadarchaeota archaeon]
MGKPVQYAEFKAPKGVIKVELELSDNIISRIFISGDFFMYPEDALERLEQALMGAKADKGSLLDAVRRFYSLTDAQTPMVEPEHWVEAVLRAAGGGQG